MMLIEERGLTLVKSCDDITIYSRIHKPAIVVKNGELHLKYSRSSPLSDTNDSVLERLDWSSTEVKSLDIVRCAS